MHSIPRLHFYLHMTSVTVAAALAILCLCSLHFLNNLQNLTFRLSNKGIFPSKAVMIS